MVHPIPEPSVEETMLTIQNPIIGEPSKDFTWFSKAELIAWGENLEAGTTQLNLETPAQRETEAERWIRNAEAGTPISKSRAEEMVTYCWKDNVSHLSNGFVHLTHTQVHIYHDHWTDNRQFEIVAQGAKVPWRFPPDSDYIPPDIPEPSVMPSAGLSISLTDRSSDATSRSSTRR